jgi:hypothetical protein
MSKYELFEPQNESFEEFVSRNISSESSRCGEDKFTPEALKGLVNEEFDNILYYNKGGKGIKGYEIEIKYNENKYYEFTAKAVPKKIDIRFGCELETCFILNCRKEVRKEIEEILGGEDIYVKGFDKKWTKLIYYHLRNNIIPYLKPEFTKIFRFANIHGGFFLDMKNGNLVNEKSILERGNYETLIFTPDGSIRCDKTQSKDDMGNVYDSIPISCEIVTPILSSIDDLKILYEGLLPKHNDFPCNQSNPSMGFHVNVSAVDEKGKIVELTRGMMAELIYDWLPYEKKNYKSLRGEGSYYAIKIQDYLNDEDTIKFFYDSIINKNDEILKVSDIYEPYGVALNHLINNVINKEKYLSMTHWKNNNVVEFRVFNSSTNIEKLISYTQDAINVFRGAIQKYCDNPEETLIQIQKQNLKYKFISFIPFSKYKGVFYDFYNFMIFRKNFITKFAFVEKSKLLGLKKEKVYGHLYNFLFDFKDFKIFIKFDDGSYYLYDVKVLDDDFVKILISNPVKYSKEDYKIQENEFKRNYKYNDIQDILEGRGF